MLVATTPQLPVTCGLVIRSSAGWLLGHTTGTPFWDLPKGKMEPDESPLAAALRECEEETGLDLRHLAEHCQDLGWRPYNRKRGKSLHLFGLSLIEPFSLEHCASRTRVLREGTLVVDMDAFAWVPEHDVPERVNRRMGKHLRKRGLVGVHAANVASHRRASFP